MQNPLVPVKNFVQNNAGKIAIVATATTVAAVALVVRNQIVFNEFLEEKDLKDEFYALEEV